MDRIGIIGGTGLISIDVEAQHQPLLQQKNLSVVRTDDIDAETEFGIVPLRCITLNSRKKSKEFGRKEKIEGLVRNGQKVVLVEDLITDGGSKWGFIESLIEKKTIIKAVLVIFNYGVLTNKLHFKNKNIDLIHLTDWQYIIEVAMLKKKIKEKDLKIIVRFLNDIGVKNLKSFQ